MELDVTKLTADELSTLQQLLSKATSEQTIETVEEQEPVKETRLIKVNGCPARYDIKYKDKTQSIMDWCRELNLPYKLIYRRIVNRGWDIATAFETPTHKPPKEIVDKHPTKECPVCHQKYVQKMSRQKTCDNEHCKAVANAKTIRDRLYKIRMAELGIQVDEMVK